MPSYWMTISVRISTDMGPRRVSEITEYLAKMLEETQKSVVEAHSNNDYPEEEVEE